MPTDYRIGRLKGRFVITWHDDDGVRRRYRLDALTAKAAEAEAIDIIRRENPPRDDLTTGGLWEAYRKHLGDRPAGITMGYTGKAILPHFGQLRPDQITTDHCRAYLAARAKAGIKTGSTWTELGHLRSCLTWAEKTGLIARAPYIERPQKPAPQERYLTTEEISRLIEVMTQPHLRLATLLMLGTAGRIGAVLGLTWDRVDMERGQINLREDMAGPRKGRAIVPMNGMLRSALSAAREAAISDYVVEWAGERVGSIKKGFAAACARAGLDDVSPHTIRHTAAVHMVAAGVPMAQVSQYLGHSSIAVTERVYARFAPDHLRAAADVLDFTKLRKVQ